MTDTLPAETKIQSRSWLKTYYFTRAAVSLVWVGIAFTFAKDLPALAGALLVAYPAWDAVANVVDAQCNGGLRRNPTQSLNAIVSTVTTAAVSTDRFGSALTSARDSPMPVTSANSNQTQRCTQPITAVGAIGVNGASRRTD